MKTPEGFDSWNRALRGAYRKGYAAGLDGLPNVSPYVDKRKQSGKLTWSRAFISAWGDGWSNGDEQRKQNHITAFCTEGANLGRRPSTWIR